MDTMKSVRDLADRHPTLQMRVVKYSAGAGKTRDNPSTLTMTTKQLFDETRVLSGAPVEDPKNPTPVQSGKALHVRDLRLIDPCNSVPCRPVIMIRERAIVLKLEHIRGIILHNAVLIMEFQGMEALGDGKFLEDKFCKQWNQQNALNEGMHQPFEFFALEVLLSTVLRGLETELNGLKADVENLKKTIKKEMSLQMLDQLRSVKQTLSDLYKRGVGVCDAIAIVLESDEDMDMMYLTSAHEEKLKQDRREAGLEDPSNSALGAMPESDESEAAAQLEQVKKTVLATGGTLTAKEEEPAEARSHDETEVLLETFLQSISNVNHEVEQLKIGLDNQEHTIELTLDLTRNSLLKLDMIFQIMTFSVSVGTLFAGIFGMNLTNHYEEDENAFWLFTGFVCGGTVLLGIIMYWITRRMVK